MSRQVESLTTETGPDDEPERARPPRPPLVELAAAILIVGGTIGLVGALTAPTLPTGSEGFLALTVALDVGSIVVGVLVRTGRLWIVDVNYVAVLGFLDLVSAASGSPIALVLGVTNVLAVVILVANKPWFDAMADWRAERAAP